VNENDPAPAVVVAVTVPPGAEVFVTACADAVNFMVPPTPPAVTTAAVPFQPSGYVAEPVPPSVIAEVTEVDPPAGTVVSAAANCIWSEAATVCAGLTSPKFTATAVPAFGAEVTVFRLIEVIVPVIVAAFAGAIEENPPIASEAAATAATFFNEIVFTIFLSFSQIKEFLLPGW